MPSTLTLLSLVPLLGGYFFIHICHLPRFRAQTLTGYRLIFEAATVGVALLIPARLIAVSAQWALGHLPPGETLVVGWQHITRSTPLVGTAALVMVGGPVAAALLNLSTGRKRPSKQQDATNLLSRIRLRWKTSKDVALDRAVRRTGNGLQRLLHDAAVRGPSDGTTLGITMEDGKLYAGWVTTSPNLHPNDQWVSILPLLSGYRTEGTRSVVYTEVYPVEEYELPVEDLDFVLMLPVAQIRSARLLDLEYFEEQVERILERRSARERSGAE